MTTPDPTPAPQTIAQVCGTTEEAWQEHLKRPAPDDYAGLSKQEVAERLKNPTPDAPATPITDAAACFPASNDSSDDMNLKGTHVDVDVARSLEKQLTAAKAETAALMRQCATYASTIMDETARADAAEAQLRERTQWQCACGGTDCAGQAENERLRAEVERLKADNESLRTLWTEIRTVLIQSRAANCVCSYGAQQADAVEAANAVLKRMPPDVTSERDQLRARVADLENDLEKSKHEADDWHRAWETVTEQAKKEVAELEQDKARLIDSIDVEALDAIANELTSFADSARAHSLMSVAARQRAAIDAARAGKGAT